MNLVISGYGSAPDASIGLFTVENGRFTGKSWSDCAEAPSYVCKGAGYIFAATETGDHSRFYAYKDGEKTGEIALDGCSALCHIVYSEKYAALYGCCYGSGNIRSARFDPESGAFTGETADYVEGGRVHSAILSRDGDTLYAANIAQDKIHSYSISAGGTLSEAGSLFCGKGRGPRHMALSENGSMLYVITEYSNEILAFTLSDGRLTQVISTLPAPTKETSHCSTLAFSSDFTRLYGANRFTDTIAEFAVSGDGTLTRLRNFTCGGENPRHMIILSDGNIVVANQNSNNVALIDVKSGLKTDSIEFFMPAGLIEA